MGVKPNLVVGVVGLAVFLLTGSIILANWRNLTGLKDWETDVETDTNDVIRGAPSTTVPPGQSREMTFAVPYENVTWFKLHLEWSESTAYQVTATLKKADGTKVAEATGTGGGAGITLLERLADVPGPARFSATDDNAAGEFEERYEPDASSNGTWRLTIKTNTPSPLPGGGITVRVLEFKVDHYVVSMSEAAELTK